MLKVKQARGRNQYLRKMGLSGEETRNIILVIKEELYHYVLLGWDVKFSCGGEVGSRFSVLSGGGVKK